MDQTMRIVTPFRRSKGTAETSEINQFWWALGDTIKATKELDTIFDENPMPATLQKRLLQNTEPDPEDARAPLKKWINRHRKEIRQMEGIMKKAIRNSPSWTL